MTTPSQLSVPGFTPPQDNQTETLKKIFVLVWSFIQKIVQQFNILVTYTTSAISAAIADASFAIVGMKIVTNSNGTAVLYSNGFAFMIYKTAVLTATNVAANSFGSTSGNTYYQTAGWNYPLALVSLLGVWGQSATGATIAVTYSSAGLSSANFILSAPTNGASVAAWLYATGYWK